MSKKRVLFIMPSMFIGGAERSLLGLLESFDYQKYDVSLFLYRHEGEFLEYIPKEVELLPEIPEYRTFDVPIKSLISGSNARFGIRRILSKIAKRLHCMRSGEKAGVWMSMQYTSRYLQPLLPNIPGKYDLGIMFLGVADVLINKVNANKKITWCHTDYDELGPNKKFDLAIYQRLDRVVAVSDACQEKIVKYYPPIQNRVITVENIIPKRLLSEQAKGEVSDLIRNSTEQYQLLSVGRFSYAKNFDSIPEICRYLVDKGIQLRWYIIGYGNDEELIRKNIIKYEVDDDVIILGKKKNPYPYIKECDLYVQPSRFEGKCVTVREAQMMAKPVVITNYATSKDQLQDGIDGIIVPQSSRECAEGIQEVLIKEELRMKLINNCMVNDYTNQQEIKKIYEWLE